MARLPTRRAGLWLSALLLLAVVSGQEAQPDRQEYDSRALSHYLDGDFAMLQGDNAAAAAAFRRALRYDHTSATIYLALAEVLMRQNLLAEAQAAAENARRVQPDDPHVYDFLARNAAARDQTAEALAHLDRWEQLDPGALEPLFRKASLHLRQKDFSGAVDTYLRIYDRNPGQEQVLPRAGELALSVGDDERAYQAYRRLYRLRKDDHRITRAYAELCVRTRRVDEALEAYELLERSGGSTLATTLQLGWLNVQQGNLSRAQAVLDSLIEQGQRQWDVLNLAGHVAERQGAFQRLATVASIMTAVYPDSAAGYLRLASAHSAQRNMEQAIEVLTEARTRFPGNANISYRLGSMYVGVERYGEAEKQLLAALELQPGAHHIQHLLATAWSGLGRYSSSDSLYEIVIQAEDDDAVAMNNYAYSLADRAPVSRRQLAAARKLSRASLKLQPDNSAFLDTYGWIRYHQKRYRTARKYITRSLEINPENPVVLEHLAEVYTRLGKPAEAETYLVRAEQIRQRRTPSLVRAPAE